MSRPLTTSSFDFPACLEPLVVDRDLVRPAMAELMAGPLDLDELGMCEWCWQFIYDPDAEVILSHFKTADGLQFCGVNVVHVSSLQSAVHRRAVAARHNAP
jgi:hypothetical protein